MKKKMKYGQRMIMHQGRLVGFCHPFAIPELLCLIAPMRSYKLLKGSNPIGIKQRIPNFLSLTPSEKRYWSKQTNS